MGSRKCKTLYLHVVGNATCVCMYETYPPIFEEDISVGRGWGGGGGSNSPTCSLRLASGMMLIIGASPTYM